MTTFSDNYENLLSLSASNLGLALDALYRAGDGDTPGEMHLDALLSSAPNLEEAELKGALTILTYILGLTTCDKYGSIKVASKRSHFVLGYVLHFLNNSMLAVKRPEVNEDEAKYLTDIISGLRSMMQDKFGYVAPVHSRRIVNVIIKGRQLRNWKYEDVYLHVYHPKWRAYHLVGIGKRHPDESDENLAYLAMKEKVGLAPHQYKLDPNIRPDSIIETYTSRSHGALTDYTFVARVGKSIGVNLNLHLDSLVARSNDFDIGSFRWFTLDEINQGVARGWKIMPSTALVLKMVDLNLVPYSTGKVRSIRDAGSIFFELGNRFSRLQLVGYLFVFVTSYLLIFQSSNILVRLNTPNQMLVNLALIARIAGAMLAALSIWLGARK